MIDIKNITDILEKEYLQKIQDMFASIIKVTTFVVDSNGSKLTTPSNCNIFCALYSNSSKYCHICKENTVNLVEESQRRKEIVVKTCPFTNLSTASSPLFFNGRFLGAWIIGQVHIQSFITNRVREISKDFRFNTNEIEQNLFKIPVLSLEEFKNILTFLDTLCMSDINLAYSNRKLRIKSKELFNTTEKLELTANMFKKLSESGNVGMYIGDFETGKIYLANEQYRKLIGDEVPILINRDGKIILKNDQNQFSNNLNENEFCSIDGSCRNEVYYNKKNIWLRITNQPIKWVDGSEAQMVTVWDCTSDHIIKSNLEYFAYNDTKLGLPNGLKLNNEILKTKEKVFLICLNVASMRNFNDAYGRKTGDVLLLTIVKWLKNQEYYKNNLYRIEGDQFAFLINDSNFSNTLRMAEDIYKRFDRVWEFNIGEQEISYSSGIYISIIPVDENIEKDEIMNIMERTLDYSKEQKSLVVYSEEIDEIEKEKVQLVLKLKECVENNLEGFDVYYQPLVEINSGRWQGLEALCRWYHPEKGFIPPNAFIYYAEQNGLINKIGDWVLEKSIKQCKIFRLDRIDDFFLSVNISPLQLMDNRFSDRIIKLLKKYKFPGEKLSLEVTESTKMSFSNFTKEVIGEIKSQGVRMALDDFGTGYSSFNNLKNLPVNFLKTERAFIVDIENDNFMQYFYSMMSELAHASNMKLIAEGVETKEQLEIMKSKGADYIQGFYFSKPLSAEELKNKLNNFYEVYEDSFNDMYSI